MCTFHFGRLNRSKPFLHIHIVWHYFSGRMLPVQHGVPQKLEKTSQVNVREFVFGRYCRFSRPHTSEQRGEFKCRTQFVVRNILSSLTETQVFEVITARVAKISGREKL